MIYKLFLLGNIIFAVAAQFMLKFGMGKIGVVAFNSQFLDKLKKMVQSPYLWLAALFFAIAFAFYTIVLSKLELGRSYPVALLGAVVLITVISVLFFNESMTGPKILGIAFCLVGIIFLL